MPVMQDRDYKYTINEFADMQMGEFPRKVDLQRLSNKANWGMNVYTKAFRKIDGKIMINPEEFWEAYKLSKKEKPNVFNRSPYGMKSKKSHL